MANLLVINSSPLSAGSNTRNLVSTFVERWSVANLEGEVVYRDVGLEPPAHIDEATIGAFYTDPTELTSEQKELVSASEAMVTELEKADAIVIGSPMHNFSITSGLKTWIDQVARRGRTFAYTENGPQGLLGGKKVYVVSARGGRYGSGSPAAAMNHQDTYLKTVLGFMGLDDVTSVNADGVASSDEGVLAAEAEIRSLFK